MFRPRYFAIGVIAGVLFGCATPAAQTAHEDPETITVNKAQLLEAVQKDLQAAFETGYWQGWKAANQENGRGL